MNRYAPPRYTRVLLLSACALCLLVAVAPFLIVWRRPEMVTTAASAIGTLIILSTALAASVLLGASTARRRVDWQAHSTLPEHGRWEDDSGGVPAPESASKSACGACGAVAGRLFCPQCGTIQDLTCGWATRLSLLVVRRWPPIIGFVLTVYVPGAYSILHESARRSAEADQRKEETARQFATAWGDFRGPLITFGAECGAEAQTGGAMSARCKELADRAIDGYTKMSWYLPGLIGELRTLACSEANADDEDKDSLRAHACRTIRADYSIALTNRAFRVFVNAYNAYVRAQATSLPSSQSAAARRCVGCAASAFYVETRRLGCSIMIASLPTSAKIDHVLPFCDSYFGVGRHDDDPPLQWAHWFGGEQQQCDDPRAVVVPQASRSQGLPSP